MFSLFLSFSDAAKFADVARNFVEGKGWGSSFSFFSPSIFDQLSKPVFDMGIFPLQPFFISLFFRVFGISDFAVVATSFFFYLLSLIFVFLLANKVFENKIIAFLSSLAVAFNLNLIDYATSGASEPLFIAEVVLAFYLVSFKKRIADVFAIFVLILAYFTRAHAFIYIAGAILFWLALRFNLKKTVFYFGAVLFFGVLFDRLVLYPFSGKFFIYSVLGGGQFAVLQHSPDWAVSDTLRGLSRQPFDLLSLGKKVFYNLYNFYKALPDILNPYLFSLFVLSFFIPSKSKTVGAFKIASLFVFIFVFLTAALSIPFYRYLHPVVPFVYILGVETLFEVIYKFQITSSKQIPNSKLQITRTMLSSKKTFLVLGICLLLIFYAVGQSVGVLVLDRRFERKIYNFGKPPVYVELARVLKENTDENQVVLTNLDTWGSWYGKRKTVWFPLEPKQLINPKNGEIPFDAIYLTNYKMDDPNYYMGEDWRMIFENPQNPEKWECDGCFEIARNYTLRGIYKINSSDVYEKEEGVGVLFVRGNE